GIRDPDVPVFSGASRVNNLSIRRPGHGVGKICFENLTRAALIFIRRDDPDAAGVYLLNRRDRARIRSEPDTVFAITVQVVRDSTRRAAGVGKQPNLCSDRRKLRLRRYDHATAVREPEYTTDARPFLGTDRLGISAVDRNLHDSRVTWTSTIEHAASDLFSIR